MTTRLSHGAFALILLAACGLLLSLAGCKSHEPRVKDELAGVTQFVANGSFEEMDGRNPKGWRSRSWQQDGDAGFAVEEIRYLNRPGVVGWWLNSRVLKRKVLPKQQLGAFRWLLPLLRAEETSPPSFGMSLLVLARRA